MPRPGRPPAAGRPLRILLATNHLRVGGAEVQLVHLARALVARGDEVRLLSLLPTEAFQADMDELSIPILHAPSRRVRSAGFIAFAVRAMRDFRPDVALSFLYQANVVTRIAARLARVPVTVSSLRNERFGHRGRELVLRFTDPLATMSTTNSRVVAERLVARRVVAARRLRVVANGLDLGRFDGVVPTPRNPEEFVWLAVGKLEAQKDFSTLIAAFAAHRQRHPRSRLWLAGDGSLREALEEQARTTGVAAAMEFLGVRDDVPSLLAGCDAFVQSAAWEGLPNVVMEAMAAGRAVVATDAGGTRELVEPGVTGLLVPPGRADLLAAAMDDLAAAGAEQRGRWGRAGRAAVEARFGVDAAVEQWLALIDSLTGANGAAVEAAR